MMRHLRVLAAALVLLSGSSFVRAQGQGASSIGIDQILKAIGVTEGSTVCEIGAGTGNMAIAAAKAVGATGRVFANELTQLDPLKVRVADSGLTNITVVAGEATRTNFPDAACDALYLHNVYHHFTDPAAINKAIFAAVKPGARVAIVDFRPPDKEAEKPEDRGKDGMHGVTPATVIREMKTAGFDEAPGAAAADPTSKSRWFLSVFVKPRGDR
jgi:ubiquinone/menaquinone biosynthesis C-methylase UbiE